LAPALSTTTKLTELDLSHNDLGDAGAASLEPALAKMTELTKLRFSHNNLGEASLASLLAKQHMSLRVKDSEGEIVHFRMRESTRLGKLMDAYCDRTNIARECILFSFSGQSISPTATPLDLDMEDDDEIDAMLHQVACIAAPM
jgi:small ubiquitin-related modifier